MNAHGLQHSSDTSAIAASRVENVTRRRTVLYALLMLGVALRVWAYASNTSLALDEILLGRNILELPLGALLTQPLQLDQVAPRGFLLVEKLVVLTVGGNELALRLFPFLSSVAGLFLFRRLAERTLDGLAVTFAVAAYAIGFPFIYYGATAKQYGIDATAAVILMLLALQIREREASNTRLLLVGAAGFVIVWFSQAAVLVMAGIGLAFALEWMISRDRRTLRALLLTIPMWALASIVAVVVGLRSMTPSTKEFMDDFWGQGFVPLPLHLVSTLAWLGDRGVSFFTSPNLLRYPWPILYLVLTLVGLVARWRRRRVVALVLIGPVVITLVGAVAQQYPFRDRLVLCLVPSVLLALAAGADWVRHQANRVHPALGLTLFLALLAPPVAAIVQNRPPYESDQSRALLGYLARHRQPGDVVYVAPLSRISTLFYGPRYGLQPADWVTSVCDRNDTRAYIRDVDRFRGVPRLWVITSGARPFRVARASVQKYLSTIGVKRDSLTLRSITIGNVAIEMYDLSDSTRLGAADAATFPVPPMPTDPRPGCREWAKSGGPADRRLESPR